MIRVIFFGTSAFAVPILARLAIDVRFQIVAVVTQPDRPTGRHAKITKSPIKILAERLNLPIMQFEKVKSDEAYEALKTIDADAAVVASFGQIIPQRVIDLTPHGMINVHGSILPKYRGASPVQAAIRDGLTETGVTIIKMDALMDHGPILAIAQEPIRPDDTGGSLHDRLAELGAKTLPDVLFAYINGRLVPQEQDHDAATSVKLLSREDGKINWAKSTAEIERMIHAYDPWPGTYMELNGKRLKILAVKIESVPSAQYDPPGTRIIDAGLPAVVCGDYVALLLTRVQPEGKAAMNGSDFLHGQRSW